MCKRSSATALKLIVDNTRGPGGAEHLLNKAVRAYWRAVRACADPVARGPEDAAIAFLTPLRTRSPRGLAQKVEILERLVETERSAEQIAEFAASIASDALSMSRRYLSRAI